jgi:predicted PurR-regulated permease PerM
MMLKKNSIFIVWSVVIAFFATLYLLHQILLPFVMGIVFAYFINPIITKLTKYHLNRSGAIFVIICIIFSLVTLSLFFIIPFMNYELSRFIQSFPSLVQQVMQKIKPLWEQAHNLLSPSDAQKIQSAAENYAGTLAQWIFQRLYAIIGTSFAFLNLLSLIFITPVVTFYLLRDWSLMMDKARLLLPRKYSAIIEMLMSQISEMLSAFIRGQALVCLSLGALYGLGLSLIGLELGFTVGVCSGFLSFIPYFGTISGLLVASALAIAQSTTSWILLFKVLGLFLVGNLIEGNVLAPKLVGEKIALHPVWVIFSLLAGGCILGFVGILIALPVAAVVGVLVRFALSRYLQSSFYHGQEE